MITQDKLKHPEKFCPTPRCLWRTTGGGPCPRHGGNQGQRFVYTYVQDGQTIVGSLRGRSDFGLSRDWKPGSQGPLTPEESKQRG